jgi:hypothetical protein
MLCMQYGNLRQRNAETKLQLLLAVHDSLVLAGYMQRVCVPRMLYLIQCPRIMYIIMTQIALKRSLCSGFLAESSAPVKTATEPSISSAAVAPATGAPTVAPGRACVRCLAAETMLTHSSPTHAQSKRRFSCIMLARWLNEERLKQTNRDEKEREKAANQA